MKKYSKWLLVLPLLLFSGCQQENKDKETEKLSEAESAFVWQADQEKKFGGYDYTVSEDELEGELKDRFNVELLPSYFEFEKVYQDDFSIDGVELKDSDYQVNASENTLTVSREIGYAKDDELVSLGTAKATYGYMEGSKKVKLASEEIQILNWTGDGEFHGKSLEDTLKKLAEILQLEDVDQLIADFNEKVADEEAIKGEIVPIYADEETAPIRKNFTVEYTTDGVLEGIYVKVTNNQV
ncbi:hypothetical protein [Enterococcus sp. BWR-S5]|uniref:hypothetical protein n=1 Tax=Enterococcus sp. BWR-S5 TaxID=2787714 RepID=UPI001923437B|nr:hypothetical protein [Enterococcus sp. BWR-S5]MBL1224923.1 hypothetical protein [Enterococcus sp. BWR-S5]